MSDNLETLATVGGWLLVILAIAYFIIRTMQSI